MSISIFELFSIGIGPSSSHTVGPMRAAQAFVNTLTLKQFLPKVHRIKIDLYGSLALTGKGHGTDLAVLNGLEGFLPETIEPSFIQPHFEEIIKNKHIYLNRVRLIEYSHNKDFLFHQHKTLPLHSNGMQFSVFDKHQDLLYEETYYSVGGGFITTAKEFNQPSSTEADVPYPFTNAATLIALCKKHEFSIAKLMLENEQVWRPLSEIKTGLLHIANIMQGCIEKGINTEGILPGGLRVKRRAPLLYNKLVENKFSSGLPPTHTELLDWLNLYALAVNEENAAGGRIVTAPTNGAAGVIPAVLNYYRVFCQQANEEGIIDFLLTAGAIALLYKKGASISAAEVGCQGEIGVACSMAAGALAAVLGGTLEQIENAAEIGMEHNLGLTCDPIAGLVQIPCIERNTMGAIQAVNAAQLALRGEGEHHVSLDKVIATMLRTGQDMQSTYKETSQGGLAVNLPEC